MTPSKQQDIHSFPALNYTNNDIALHAAEGDWTYAALYRRVNQLSSGLLDGSSDLQEERIAFFIPPSVDYVTTLLGVWRAGGIAVPLNTAASMTEIEHALSSAQATRLVVSLSTPAEVLVSLNIVCHALRILVVAVNELVSDKRAVLPHVASDRRAMILFSRGTANKPKGVVTTHKNIWAQVNAQLDAWGWRRDDSIPLFLPLHHIYGIINVLCCGLWAGAQISLFATFDIEAMLNQVQQRKFTVFMAVPTIYFKLIQHLHDIDSERRKAAGAGFRGMRLNISGADVCSIQLHKQWKALTGQTLLEFYSMTEIGTGISNPYSGERRAGFVGIPLPGVHVALFDEENHIIEGEEVSGEIRLKGDNVFLEYWNNDKATQESFIDGWFCTGDVGVREKSYYRVLERSSLAINATNGYKSSGLVVEGAVKS